MTLEIIEMAIQAGIAKEVAEINIDILETFAKLVAEAAASKERERLAQEARECGGVLTVGAILARGEV
jgi:hypothetical protein